MTRFIRSLLGEEKRFNQLGTDSVVLYRCHCSVFWKDIAYEDDEGLNCDEMDIKELDFVFNKTEYALTMNQFLKSATDFFEES